MLDFQTFPSQETELQEEEPEPKPTIAVEEAADSYGKFVAEPLPQGFGMTLGNPLRRVLYSSLPGSAVTWVKVEGVLHEYTTMPHITEEVSEFLLNVKGIRLRSQVDRPGKLRLEVAGQGEVCAGDIIASSEFEVVNPELHLATLDSDEAKLSVEMNVERGTGFAEASRRDGLPIGVLPVDALYTPVRKVNYTIENLRVGQRTDFERLILEIWTDGSISPVEALRRAGSILFDHFFLYAHTQQDTEDGADGPPRIPTLPPEQYNIPVEALELSSRTLNCLKRASIDIVGKVLDMKKEDLLQIRNFGDKSLAELYGRLADMGLLPEEQQDADKDEKAEGQEVAEDAQQDLVEVGADTSEKIDEGE